MINGECFAGTGAWDAPDKIWSAIGITSDHQMVWVTGNYPYIQKALAGTNVQQAIKLDGGGSTKLWYNGREIVPSNREVADALLVFSLQFVEVLD